MSWFDDFDCFAHIDEFGPYSLYPDEINACQNDEENLESLYKTAPEPEKSAKSEIAIDKDDVLVFANMLRKYGYKVDITLRFWKEES